MESRFKNGVDAAADEEIKPCLSCFAPNPVSAVLCVECGALFGSGTGLSPMSTVRSEAVFIEGLVPGHKNKGKPLLIRLIVVWLILLPIAVTSIAVCISNAYHRDGLLSFAVFWVGVGMFLFSLSGLYRTTRAYIRPNVSADSIKDQ
jgi:hypothetical protein